MSLKTIILSVFAALLFFFSAPATAAPASVQCTLTDVHNHIAEWRSDNALLIDGYQTFAKALLNFEIIEGRLVTQCEGVKSHLTKMEKFLAVIQPASKIPSLKGFIKPVQQIGERLNSDVLKKPQKAVCDTVIKIRSRIDGVATKFKKVQNTKIAKVSNLFVTAHDSVADVLEKYEDAGGNPTNCVPLNSLCAAVQEATALQRKLIDEIKDLLDQTSFFRTFMNDVENGISKATRVIDSIFDGAVGTVLDGVEGLMSKRISLPIPRGSKDRGVGVIPTCCPSGYSNQGGLCYRNCRSGYSAVLFTCVEKCRSGWTDIGVTCTRLKTKKIGFIKVKIPQFDAKHSYSRGVGKIPATFGDAACSCRRDKRYLEAGLCYNKCGRDHFRQYSTPFLTTCLDLRSTTLTVADLVDHLDIFEKAKKIPGLASAIRAVDRLINTAFAVLTRPIQDALNIPAPRLGFPTNIPGLSALDALDQVIDVRVFGAINNLADALLRATSCRNPQ